MATNTASVKVETPVEVNGFIKSQSIYRLGFSGQGVREARGLVRSNDLSGGAAIRCVPNIDPLFWAISAKDQWQGNSLTEIQ